MTTAPITSAIAQDAAAVGIGSSVLLAVSVLFARRDSIYKTLPGVDVWDADRDALNWHGGNSVVAHPPCRAWGTLSHFARPREGEKDLALWAVDQVRTWGGVLEHPSRSRLWPAAGLPEPGSRDEFGGWTLPILQWWWGHRAEKATRLYICGCDPRDIPPIPCRIGEAECMVSGDRRKSGKPGLSQNNRERTPPDLAKWLVEVARLCSANTECTERNSG